MTQSYAALMECPELVPIPNRDRISTITIGGYDVIVRNCDFKKGDLGLFISVDSILPDDMVNFYGISHLKKNRVKTLKLKSVYSQGLFLPLTFDKLKPFEKSQMYENIAEPLGIVKWQPETKLTRFGGKYVKVRNWPDPRIEVYDIESIQRPDFSTTFNEGVDEVVVSEKIHGMNATFCTISGKNYVMSRRVCFERDRPEALLNQQLEEQTNIFYHIYDKYNFEKIFDEVKSLDHDMIIRGEIYGKNVQNLTYGLKGVDFKAFDIQFNIGEYVDYDIFHKTCIDNNIPMVPELYRGIFKKEIVEKLAEQNSRICPDQISEGIVIRDPKEIIEKNMPRRILKRISKRYASKDDTNENLDN